MPTWRLIAIKIKRKAFILSVLLIPTCLFCYILKPNQFIEYQSTQKRDKNSHEIRTKRLDSTFSIEGSDDRQEYESAANSESGFHHDHLASPGSKSLSDSIKINENINYNVHAFYYAWYAAPEVDGAWWHWNHAYIPPWDKNDHNIYPTGAHKPPLDIGANFYPELGPYSSRDPDVIDSHMRIMANINIGVISVSWYPPGMADENGLPTDEMIPVLLAAVHKHGMKVCLHVEPYEGRNASNFRSFLAYVNKEYGAHPAYYRVKKGGRELPLFYVYDSYRVTVEEWQKILTASGNLSVRATELDAVFIGLVVEYKHRADIKSAGFDGFYTYFAANGFSYGSSWKNWKSLASFAYKNSLTFIPSVGPGYIDTRIRPWNSKNTHARRKGLYYDTAWKTAIGAPARLVSITSFNEWHEGTQIEPAIPMSCTNFTYQDYQPNTPDFYMQLTGKWVAQLSKSTKRNKN